MAIRVREENSDLETDALRPLAVRAKETHVALPPIAADHRPSSGCGSATNRTFPPAPVTSTAGAGGFQNYQRRHYDPGLRTQVVGTILSMKFTVALTLQSDLVHRCEVDLAKVACPSSLVACTGTWNAASSNKCP